MNTPTDKELRDWYMGYGVEGRAELAKEEGDAFDRYMVERDAKVAKATEERIIKLLEEHTPIKDSYNMESSCHGCDWEWAWGSEVKDSHEDHIIRLIKGETKLFLTAAQVEQNG